MEQEGGMAMSIKEVKCEGLNSCPLCGERAYLHAIEIKKSKLFGLPMIHCTQCGYGITPITDNWSLKKRVRKSMIRGIVKYWNSLTPDNIEEMF